MSPLTCHNKLFLLTCHSKLYLLTCHIKMSLLTCRIKMSLMTYHNKMSLLTCHSIILCHNEFTGGPSFVNTTTCHLLPSTLEPKNIMQALKNPLWCQDMDDEFNSLLHNYKWDLIPQSMHYIVGCKWVFRVKQRADGSFDR
ncbi:hypothetical protein GQ457_03G020610 [Hibiscus cannabinus]